MAEIPSNIPKRKPKTTRTTAKALSVALDGREAPYPAWRLRGRIFMERAKHNPFKDL